MKEQALDGMFKGRFRVYPHLDADASSLLMGSAAYLEVVCYEGEWRVLLNIHYHSLLTRKKSDELQAAISRCWEWIDEQKQA